MYAEGWSTETVPRLEGFEPPTRGLGMRLHSSYTILACQQISPIYAVFGDADASNFLLSSAPCWPGCSTVAVNGPGFLTGLSLFDPCFRYFGR
jgi:hypothetical protein